MGTAVKVENLSKAYQLGEIGTGTLSNDLKRWAYKVRGKEDPFLKIGETNDRTTKGESDMVWSLKDLNFEIEQGDAVGIIGRNGAGKSTLLKILSRVTSPTTGSVKVKGRVASLLEVGTGFHPELTGRENIFLNGAILGMRKAEIKKHFDAIVDFAGVERYIDTPVKRYSSGMYVRLAFAVAAHLESEILIVDEVLAVGDAEFQKKCLGKMGEVSKGEGKTILFVSHNMSSILRLCSKGILLSNGTIKMDGGMNEVVNRYLASKKNEHIISSSSSEEIKITNLLFKDRYGEELSFLTTFQDTIIEMYCEASEFINDVSFAVCFTDIHDTRITSLWTSYNAKTFDINVNKFIISFEISKLKLMPGEYEIVTYIESRGREIQRIDSYKQFSVKYTSDFGITIEPKSSQGLYIEDFKVILNH
ncbi:MAG TPA: ABC transporter ATP-binding protein [Pelobium sp.]|nr:ABC transporter ATP-binding protein [Pelobium sp.]